jgi:hypothetical protein
VATVSDGQNPGRSATPQRQSPSPARSGHGEVTGGPTVQRGQLPDEIFGFPQSYSTGAPGSGGGAMDSSDVTVQDGQISDGMSGLTKAEVVETGMPGSQGARPHAGGEGIRYTDPFGYMGNDHRDSHASGTISGPGEWTAFGDDNGFTGPTLPGLEGNRPVSTGIGGGSVTGASHPDAMDSGPQPRNGNGGRAAGPRHPDAGR